MIRKALGIIFIVCILLLGFLAFSCIRNVTGEKQEVSWWEIPIVAHAGGGISGNTNTNSLEALQQAEKNGYRLIEIDFSLTCDGELVLLHDWDEDTIKGLELEDAVKRAENGVLDLKTFLDTKICRKYTSLAARDLITWMKNNPNTYIMTDMKVLDEKNLKEQYQRLVELCDRDSSLLERFVVQVYSPETYDYIMEVYRFKNVLYATYPFAENDRNYWEKVAADCRDRNIRVVPVPRCYVSTSKHPIMPCIDILKEKGLFICTHTVNTITDMERMLAAGADMIVTDFLTEEDLQHVRLK